MLFKNFLRSEYSEENIDFWEACEEYRQLKPKQFAARAQKIYSEYVTAHAPREVGVLGLFFNSTEPGLCWSAGFWQDYIMYKEHIYFQIFYVGLLKGNSCFQLN